MTKNKIKSISLIGIRSKTSNSYGRNLPYMRYRVLISFDESGVRTYKPIEEVFTREELKQIGYWSTRSNSMSMTCWGTSQLFEAQISLARWLGIDSKNWPEFSRNATSIVKEL